MVTGSRILAMRVTKTPDPIEAITFWIGQLGMTWKDLETVPGGRGRVSETLMKKQSLSLEMIRRLHRELHIPLESLIGTPSPSRRWPSAIPA